MGQKSSHPQPPSPSIRRVPDRFVQTALDMDWFDLEKVPKPVIQLIALYYCTTGILCAVLYGTAHHENKNDRFCVGVITNSSGSQIALFRSPAFE